MIEVFPITLSTLLCSFGGALALSFCLTWLLTHFMKGTHPLARYLLHQSLSHKDEVEVSPFGGTGVIASFLGILWFCYFFSIIPIYLFTSLLLLTVGVLATILLGFVDDLVNLKARLKLVVQMFIALFLIANGFVAAQVGDWTLAGLGAVWTLFWIVGIMNGFNLVDGQDGLSTGLAFITCGFAALVFWDRQIYEACLMATVLAGSALGFLPFNFPPAKIYLGNTGSLPLGLLVALIFVSSWSRGHVDEIYFLIPIAFLVIPISDTIFAFFRRIFKGISPFTRDSEHLHHRLEKFGFTPKQSIYILFSITLYFNIVTFIYSSNVDAVPYFTPLFLVFLVLNVCLMILTLTYCEDLRNGRTFPLQWGTNGKYVLIGLLVALNVGFFIGAITHLV